MASNDSDARPLIGITTYVEQARFGVWDSETALLPRSYVDAVVRAGGVPVLVPPVGTGYGEIAARIDGLVLSGGADVDPARYGQAPHERTRVIRPDRDEFELGLFRAARERRLPIFAVCRGMQLVNVAFGGTLVQHLADGDEHLPTPGVFGSHAVTTLEGSRVHAIAGTEVTVSCHHHQAIDTVGAGLRVTAWSAGGVVEAVESTDDAGPYLVGVQWHPEEDRVDRRLFEAFVVAAGRGSVS